MEIYRLALRYNRKTGKEDGVEFEWVETRCDYTGSVLTGDGYSKYYCKFELDYGDQDACFGASGDEYEFGQKHDIDMYEFLYQRYAIYDDETVWNKFFKEAAKFGTLDGALRAFRVRTAEKLIKSGEVKAEQFRLG